MPENKTNLNVDIFIKELLDAYSNARNANIFFDVNKENICRGRSASISSKSEDMLACLLAKELNDRELYFFIDQPVKTSGSNKYNYPDILICRKQGKNHFKALYMCDVKTDLGWIRNKISAICEAHSKTNLSSCEVNNGMNKDGSKRKINIDFEENIAYDIIVISECNAPKEKIKELKMEKYDKSKIFFLTHGEHPNEYKDKSKINIKANYDECKQLFKRIKKQVN